MSNGAADTGQPERDGTERGASPSRRFFGTVGAALTVAAAVWGALTGTLALIDQRQVELTIRVDDRYLLNGPEEGIRVNFINSSNRGVALVGGEVRAEGEQVGRIVGVVLNQRDLSPPAWSPVPWRRFPVTIASQQAVAGAVLWDKPSLRATGVGAAPRDPIGELQERLAELDYKARDSGQRRPRAVHAQVQLRLRFEPGGWRETPLTIWLLRERGGARRYEESALLDRRAWRGTQPVGTAAGEGRGSEGARDGHTYPVAVRPSWREATLYTSAARVPCAFSWLATPAWCLHLYASARRPNIREVQFSYPLQFCGTTCRASGDTPSGRLVPVDECTPRRNRP